MPDALDDLVYAWQRELDDHGRDAPADELCRDRPDLADELNRRLRVLRRVEGLLAEGGSADETTACFQAASAPDDRPPVPPGYELLDVVGTGGMGVVYKVRHLDPPRVEALKMIRSGDFASERDRARFRFEAEATAGLEHPNIVTLYAVGEVAGRPYLALRYIDGTSLAERLKAGPLPQRQAAALVEKVARAVHYAHQRGILHRDLKPANILLDQAGEPYVGDFGVARRLDATQTMTELGAVVGTPAYMPPEQARGDRNPTAAADVYALGVVLYEALTGRRPFAGRDAFAILRQVIDAEPTPPRSLVPSLDADLEAVVLKCLEKEPARRYASAADLAADLERYRHGEAVTARPPGFWDWLAQMMRTRPEPHLKFAWPVSVWAGATALGMNGAIFALTRADGPALGVWLASGLSVVVMSVVFWWYMLRRFRHLPQSERHSLVMGGGYMAVAVALTAAYVPVSWDASARAALAMYPALGAVTGMSLFVLGSTNWSRFFFVGLAMIALAPVLAWWPEPAPLVYGLATAIVMGYWAYAKATAFGRRAAAD